MAMLNLTCPFAGFVTFLVATKSVAPTWPETATTSRLMQPNHRLLEHHRLLEPTGLYASPRRSTGEQLGR
jgi:hypothetical protein